MNFGVDVAALWTGIGVLVAVALAFIVLADRLGRRYGAAAIGWVWGLSSLVFGVVGAMRVRWQQLGLGVPAANVRTFSHTVTFTILAAVAFGGVALLTRRRLQMARPFQVGSAVAGVAVFCAGFVLFFVLMLALELAGVPLPIR